MAHVSKDMTFGQLLLLEAGMGCIGCPHSQMESIEDGAMGHGIDPDLLIEKLNATISAAEV